MISLHKKSEYVFCEEFSTNCLYNNKATSTVALQTGNEYKYLLVSRAVMLPMVLMVLMVEDLVRSSPFTFRFVTFHKPVMLSLYETKSLTVT